jgi:hypothetical protein
MSTQRILSPPFARRVVLCTCLTHEHRYDMDKCLHWMCICGNTQASAGFCQVSQWQEDRHTKFECCQCHRVFDGVTGLEEV